MSTKSKTACEFSCERLMKGKTKCYLWTFTLGGTWSDYRDISNYWRAFQRLYSKSNPMFRCVRVFEPHPNGHGWHLHFVTDQFLDVRKIRKYSSAAGFGRIDVQGRAIDRALYVAKYITKVNRGKDYRGCRLWGCVGFDGVKVREVISEGPFCDALKARTERMTHRANKLSLKKIRYMAFLITICEFSGGEAQIMRRFRDGISSVEENYWVYADVMNYPLDGIEGVA